jgi:hypothetical protein
MAGNPIVFSDPQGLNDVTKYANEKNSFANLGRDLQQGDYYHDDNGNRWDFLSYNEDKTSMWMNIGEASFSPVESDKFFWESDWQPEKFLDVSGWGSLPIKEYDSWLDINNPSIFAYNVAANFQNNFYGTIDAIVNPHVTIWQLTKFNEALGLEFQNFLRNGIDINAVGIAAKDIFTNPHTYESLVPMLLFRRPTSRAGVMTRPASVIDDVAEGVGKTITKVEQYALRAAEDGFYPVMERGFQQPQGLVWLNKDEIWKFGTTVNPETRYTQKYLRDLRIYYDPEFTGTLQEALQLENMKILNHEFQTGLLPPGNKIRK